MPNKENNLEEKINNDEMVVSSNETNEIQNHSSESAMLDDNSITEISNNVVTELEIENTIVSNIDNTELNKAAETIQISDEKNEFAVEEEDEDEENKIIDEEEAINTDYSSYSKSELLDLALKASKMLAPREAIKKIQNIRPFIESKIKEERLEQLNKYKSEGNEEENFEFIEDGTRQQFYNAYKLAQESRAEERIRIEQEKLKNLNAKNAIIDRIKELTEIDENVNSIEEIKKLQNEWKTIRAVPKQYLQELYDRYHIYLDKFYDNYAINRELKDLDRQKNLDTKIDLCNKLEALKTEPSAKRVFILLAKYQEEFKNTGPVPKEFNEEIWNRFKNTRDEIYNDKKEQFDKLQEKRNENLRLKEVLIEKARIIANYISSKPNEWKTNAEELNKLMDEWKTIGQVPKSQSESNWNSFREQFSTFSKNQSEYYKKLSQQRKNIVSIKEELCNRAESIMNNENYDETAKEFISLQEEWKKSGHLPEAKSNELWLRFRAACDVFFNRRQELINENKSKETENLNLKNSIIEEIEGLQTNDDIDNAFVKLKELQQKWNDIGFVPFQHKKKITEKYQLALDKLYKKFHKNRENYKQAHIKEHYREIANRPDGQKKLGDEERKIREKIKGLTYEISTLENNLGFFSRSKNAEKLISDIEKKIKLLGEQVEKLKKELTALKSAK
ncbi:MAG: DUF349 domain-containing protein [Bacteroidia bacterium]|nr:DUF349 domain-containing protein [Bacteroidia bacterium]